MNLKDLTDDEIRELFRVSDQTQALFNEMEPARLAAQAIGEPGAPPAADRSTFFNRIRPWIQPANPRTGTRPGEIWDNVRELNAERRGLEPPRRYMPRGVTAEGGVPPWESLRYAPGKEPPIEERSSEERSFDRPASPSQSSYGAGFLASRSDAELYEILHQAGQISDDRYLQLKYGLGETDGSLPTEAPADASGVGGGQTTLPPTDDFVGPPRPEQETYEQRARRVYGEILGEEKPETWLEKPRRVIGAIGDGMMAGAIAARGGDPRIATQQAQMLEQERMRQSDRLRMQADEALAQAKLFDTFGNPQEVYLKVQQEMAETQRLLAQTGLSEAERANKMLELEQGQIVLALMEKMMADRGIQGRQVPQGQGGGRPLVNPDELIIPEHLR